MQIINKKSKKKKILFLAIIFSFLIIGTMLTACNRNSQSSYTVSYETKLDTPIAGIPSVYTDKKTYKKGDLITVPDLLNNLKKWFKNIDWMVLE